MSRMFYFFSCKGWFLVFSLTTYASLCTKMDQVCASAVYMSFSVLHEIAFHLKVSPTIAVFTYVPVFTVKSGLDNL